ncbi:hypothetical protein GUJ93_ZPchr0006g41597 [Zizania palustris]|uniref:Uncharacterized protein n=1 Tax=Zizania palustris TaxID=103762 RepID=A0A8J5VJV9_ZIZPA|nr:hypothetical protein GUJ93_ZPchr0006g41597 [Zizania palustris]
MEDAPHCCLPPPCFGRHGAAQRVLVSTRSSAGAGGALGEEKEGLGKIFILDIDILSECPVRSKFGAIFLQSLDILQYKRS